MHGVRADFIYLELSIPFNTSQVIEIVCCSHLNQNMALILVTDKRRFSINSMKNTQSGEQDSHSNGVATNV